PQLGLGRVTPPVRGRPHVTVPVALRPWRRRARAVRRGEDAGLPARPGHVRDRQGRCGAAHVFLASAGYAAQPSGAGGAGRPGGGPSHRDGVSPGESTALPQGVSRTVTSRSSVPTPPSLSVTVTRTRSVAGRTYRWLAVIGS